MTVNKKDKSRLFAAKQLTNTGTVIDFFKLYPGVRFSLQALTGEDTGFTDKAYSICRELARQGVLKWKWDVNPCTKGRIKVYYLPGSFSVTVDHTVHGPLLSSILLPGVEIPVLIRSVKNWHGKNNQYSVFLLFPRGWEAGVMFKNDYLFSFTHRPRAGYHAHEAGLEPLEKHLDSRETAAVQLVLDVSCTEHEILAGNEPLQVNLDQYAVDVPAGEPFKQVIGNHVITVKKGDEFYSLEISWNEELESASLGIISNAENGDLMEYKPVSPELRDAGKVTLKQVEQQCRSICH